MKLYNTLTRTKEEFVPLEEGKVKMYVCGPTVYNYIHIGNARPFIMFDALRRYLQYKGYDVTFVQNFTDVDDKIIKRGHEEGISPEEVADKYIDEYFVDAGKFIIGKDKASIGMLQRVYKIGFNRAARIMDQLSDAGVVGPEEGTKPRKVLMTLEELEEL